MESITREDTVFSTPPWTFTDAENRSVSIERHTDGVEPLVEMYQHFDSASSSQGLPPRTEERTREWLTALQPDSIDVVARHDGTPIGHALLVPYDDTSELAIFVRPEYQSVGIGTHLIRGLLGVGQNEGISHVWLSVARENRIAMRLYRSAGFEVSEHDRGEFKMERTL